MFPGPSEGLTAHTNAVGRILQAHGPERYQTGILHKLFIGFRPLLVSSTSHCLRKHLIFRR